MFKNDTSIFLQILNSETLYGTGFFRKFAKKPYKQKVSKLTFRKTHWAYVYIDSSSV